MHPGLRCSLAVLLLVACKDADPSDPATATDTTTDPSGDPSGDPSTVPTTGEPTTGEPAENTVALAVKRDVDLLFVVDNSGSMAEEQQLLAQAFPALLNVLAAPDVRANFRIGFTTTDAGNPRCPGPVTTPENGNLVLSSCLDRVDAGEFTVQDLDFSAACTANCDLRDADLAVLGTTTELDDTKIPREWIEVTGGVANIQGADTAAALACYAPQGLAGCGFESHLEAMYKALAAAKSKTSKNNYGFLREAAVLALVIVSDETDCSYNPEFQDIFTTNKVFWNDPVSDVAPTSAMCWAAGVACDGPAPNYSACHAENHDSTGNPGAVDDQAVLFPPTKYIEFVASIEQNKQAFDADAQVIVSLIAGVPPGYDSYAAEIPYADSPDFNFQASFGIGPGCIADPTTTAVPPVREREFAEAFNEDPDARRNLYSVCDPDYSAAMASIGERIRGQMRPSCMPNCVADTKPVTPELDPSCTVFEENLVAQTQTPIVGCVEGEDMMGAPIWQVPAGETVCFAQLIDRDTFTTPSTLDNMSLECVEEGFNLEFEIVRAGPAPAGVTISASCELSPDKAKDCPNL